ncbi:MAG: histidine kinase [Bosea sp.]|nr:histidine kinase [Bosea sp. (in: a-proteobacteria)]
MPTLFRFLGLLAVIGALGLGAMVALATLVQPEGREMTVTIPPSRFVK